MYMFSTCMPGYSHMAVNKGCEDYIAKAAKDGVAAMCLCDGAGSYDMVKEGAAYMATQLSRFMTANFRRLLTLPEEQVRFLFTEQITLNIARLRLRYPDARGPHAFASTALVTGYEPASHRYLAVHLGDGAIGAIGNDDVYSLVTDPRRRTSERGTCLTTMSPWAVMDNMQVAGGTARGMFLCSDGGEDIIYDTGTCRVGDAVSIIVTGLSKAVSGMAFKTGVDDSIKEDLQPYDDLSIGIIVLGTPARVRTTNLSVRRRQRALIRYALMREKGFSRNTASRLAGWGRNRRRKLADAKSRFIY